MRKWYFLKCHNAKHLRVLNVIPEEHFLYIKLKGKKMLAFSKSYSSLVSLYPCIWRMCFAVEQPVQDFKMLTFLTVFWEYFLFSELVYVFICFIWSVYKMWVLCSILNLCLYGLKNELNSMKNELKAVEV